MRRRDRDLRAAILSLLRDAGPATTRDLARVLRRDPAVIGLAVGALADEGAIDQAATIADEAVWSVRQDVRVSAARS